MYINFHKIVVVVVAAAAAAAASSSSNSNSSAVLALDTCGRYTDDDGVVAMGDDV
jgi:hypothetical protein